MTKKIRVENADNSNWKVVAYVEDMIDGQWTRVQTIELPYPASLSEVYLTSTRRVVVEELP